MPVRQRRRRVHGNELTMRRCIALEIGPSDHDEPLEVLREVWREDRRRIGDDSWAADYFERGIDRRAGEHAVPIATDLGRSVGLPGV